MDDWIGPWRRWWLFVVAGLVLAFLVLPVLIVIPVSFSASTLLEFPPRAWSLRWYEGFFGSVEWRDATWMSTKVAVLTTSQWVLWSAWLTRAIGEVDLEVFEDEAEAKDWLQE